MLDTSLVIGLMPAPVGVVHGSPVTPEPHTLLNKITNKQKQAQSFRQYKYLSAVTCTFIEMLFFIHPATY